MTKFNGGALISGKKVHNDPCSEGTWFKKSCSDGLVCITVPEGLRYQEGDKIYDGYCAPPGTNPDDLDVWVGGRKSRSNKGKKRTPYGPRTGKTRSGKRFRTVTKSRKVGRKTRSNKGKKRTPYGPRTGKTRSGRKFRS